MSRTSSQQRIQDPDQVVSESPTSDWRQQRSISRNDSQRSLTDYQQQLRQPDPLITTTIDETSILDTPRPAVTFRNDEYDQQNLQPMVEQGGPIYDDGLQQQQQYQEPTYDQQQPEYQQDYGYGTNQQYGNYDQTQPIVGPAYPTTNYEPQPEQYDPGAYQSESRRQSPEKEIYQPEYVEPQTPKRSTPPKRDSPPRESAEEAAAKSVQQRQQSRDQLYGRDKAETPDEAPTRNVQSRQLSRESIQEGQQKSPSPTSVSGTPTSAAAARNRAKPGAKSATEQDKGRNSVGEANRGGRKSDAMQKQPAKTATSIRGKK